MASDNAGLSTRPFGSLVPFAESGWARGLPSPYYNASHVRLRAELRAFIDEELEILENAHAWTEEGEVPKEVYQKAVKAGLIAWVSSTKVSLLL